MLPVIRDINNFVELYSVPHVHMNGLYLYRINVHMDDLSLCWINVQTSSKTMKKLANPNAPLGYTLCFLNLAFDGYTNSTQDLIKSRFSCLLSF